MNKRFSSSRLHFVRVPEVEPLEQPTGFFRRALGALRFPSRERSPLDKAAAQGRVTRLFAVNFKSTWTR